MNSTALLIAALIALPALALVTWAWLAIAKVERELRALDGFEGMHFEIGPEQAQEPEGASWPIPAGRRS